MEQRLLEEDLKMNRQNSSQDGKKGDGEDLLDRFSRKFKKGLSEFKGMFNDEDEEKDTTQPT
jgi:hypothetical protein